MVVLEDQYIEKGRCKQKYLKVHIQHNILINIQVMLLNNLFLKHN
jgi:hypothetical protein